MASAAPPAQHPLPASAEAAVMDGAAEHTVPPQPQVVSQPVYVPPPAPVSNASSKPGKAEAGLPVGLIGAAVAGTLTLLAAGLSIAKKNKGSKPAAAGRSGSKAAGSKAAAASGGSGRSAGSRASGAAGAARSSGTAQRSSSSAGGRRSSTASTSGGGSSSSRPSSRTAASRSARPAAAAAAAGGAAVAATAAAAAAPPARKPAARKPPAAAPAAVAAPAAEAAAPAPAPAAAAPKPAPAATPVAPAPAAVAEQPKKAASEPATPPATTPAAAAATPPPPAAPAAVAEPEPSAPVTPAADVEAAPEAAAPTRPMLQELAAAAAAPAALAAAPAADAAPAKAPAAAAEEPAAAAPAAAEEPAPAAAAPAESAAAEEPAAASAEAEGGTEQAAAAAEGGAEGEEEEGDLIELAEGETLPVVDEAGNTLGTLHHDGRVLDAEGNVIGGLDEEGNVMLYEQQPGADEMIILSPAEEEAEQLMRQAAMAWNMHQNRELAEKFQRKALEAVTREEGAARPEIVAEVASSLADMLYATSKMGQAKDALQVALDAAEKSEQHALYIKLSNNMGAVLRKQELHAESKSLHEKAMQMALDKFGVAHATTTLARGNLVDALDQLGERGEARRLLNESVAAIKEYAVQKEADEAAAGTSQANGSDTAAAAAAAATNGADEEEGESAAAADGQKTSETMASMLAVDSKRAATAAIRAQIDLARLEMKEKDFTRAIVVLESALGMATDKFGADTAEASSVMAALATCHRQAGDLDTSARLFCQLFEINEAQSEGGAANQSGVMLARTLADLYQEAEQDSEALKWAEKALDLMQEVSELPRTHPALEAHINLVVELKAKTGDEAGAEEMRKELLKNKAKLVAAMQRQGAAGGRGAAGARGGAAAAAAAAAAAGGRANGAAGKKGGGRKK